MCPGSGFRLQGDRLIEVAFDNITLYDGFAPN